MSACHVCTLRNVKGLWNPVSVLQHWHLDCNTNYIGPSSKGDYLIYLHGSGILEPVAAHEVIYCVKQLSPRNWRYRSLAGGYWYHWNCWSWWWWFQMRPLQGTPQKSQLFKWFQFVALLVLIVWCVCCSDPLHSLRRTPVWVILQRTPRCVFELKSLDYLQTQLRYFI